MSIYIDLDDSIMNNASEALAQLLNSIKRARGCKVTEFLEDNGCVAVTREASVDFSGNTVNAYLLAVPAASEGGELVTTWVAHDTSINYWFDTKYGECEDYDFGLSEGTMDFWWLMNHLSHCDWTGVLSLEKRIGYLRDFKGLNGAEICEMVDDYTDQDGTYWRHRRFGCGASEKIEIVHYCPKTDEEIGTWDVRASGDNWYYVTATIYKTPGGHFYAHGDCGARSEFSHCPIAQLKIAGCAFRDMSRAEVEGITGRELVA